METEKKGKEVNIFHKIHPSVYAERFKSVSLLVSQNAQQQKYGDEEVDSTVSESFYSICQNGSQDSANSKITVKKMNSFTADKLEKYGLPVFGIRDLFGKKTVWVNQDHFQNQPKEAQDYMLSCGIAETELMHPELKTLVVSETIVGLTSLTLFRRAKLIQREMAQLMIKNLRAYSTVRSMIFWEHPILKSSILNNPKKRLRPGVFKAAGWGIAFAGPLLVIPYTSLEKQIINKHKFDSIALASQTDTGFSHLAQLASLNFKESDNQVALHQDELNFIGHLVEKKKKQLHKDNERSNFNFYTCKEQCTEKECECKKNLFETKESDSCTLITAQCLQECHYKVKRIPHSGFKRKRCTSEN